MPLTDCPFISSSDNIFRPWLQIRIINPHTGLNQKTWGLIDTGADECAIPAKYAKLLGHNLRCGAKRPLNTGDGKTFGYTHTTKFEIFIPSTEDVAYIIDDTPIDFMPKLQVVLLGVNSFLSKFILHIDYPRNLFSIKYP